MKFLVYGAGAIGSVFGGFLARAGHTVVLLGRSAHMEAVRQGGLKITGLWGDYTVRTIETATDSAAVRQKHGQSFDVILLAVRAYDTCDAAPDVARYSGPQTLLVSLQNGLGNLETLSPHVPPEKIIGGRVIFGANVVFPGVVNVTVEADATVIGKISEKLSDRPVAALAQVFNEARLKCRTTDNIYSVIWAKVAYNAALNPLSAIHSCSYGELLKSEETKTSMRKVVEELYGVAKADGITMDPPTAGAYVDLLFTRLIPVTAAHRSSMAQAVEKGRRTEIDALNGAIVHLGRKYGIPTPENERLVTAIKAKESKNG